MDAYQINNPFKACVDVLFKPNKVFAQLSDKHNWSWIPFFLVCLFTTLPLYAYLSSVDINWYVEYQVSAQLGDVSPAEQQTLRSLLLSQFSNHTIPVLSLFITIVIINAIYAYYLHLTTKSDEYNVNGFTDWYGFVWWTQLPVFVTAISTFLVILFASSNQIPPESLNMTSVSYLLGIKFSSPWYSLTNSVDLGTIWSIYLVSVGLNQWTRLSARRTLIIAVIPYLLIWGILAVINIIYA